MDELPRAPAPGDAFGQILQRCWAAGGGAGVAYEVIERDDGYIDVGDAARYFTGPQLWSPSERWACGQASGWVLDVGCGAGRHAVVVAAAGCEVVGLDASPGAVSVAVDRGVRTVQGSVFQLPAGLGCFDTFLMLGNNLGLLASRVLAPVVLRGLAAVARPGARLYGSGLDPYGTSNEAHHAYHAWNRRRGWLPGQVRMRVRDGLTATGWFDYLFASPEELAGLVADTPWTLTHVERDDPNYVACLQLR